VDEKTVIRPGDQVLAIVQNDAALDLRKALLGSR
jgi:hypothetical protein